jgi:hypothetical protein
MFNPWQSVKVVNDRSEFFGRAGIVIREESKGIIVQLDETPDGKAKEVITFNAGELVVL